MERWAFIIVVDTVDKSVMFVFLGFERTDEADVDNADLINEADEAIVAKAANEANKTNVAKEVDKSNDSNGAKEANETKNPTIYQVDKTKDQMVTKATLKKKIILDYWNKHNLEDSIYRKELQLTY